MKKIYSFLSFSFCVFIAAAQNPSKAVAKVFSPGIAFTCITVDSANTIWAGTNGRGIYKIANEVVEPVIITNNNFDEVSIKQIAAYKDKGIWVAHEGYSSATYGGIDYLDVIVPANRQHYTAVSLINTAVKGFPSRRVEGITVDPSGKVWSAHSYHDLTVAGGNPSYLVNPGGLGFKTLAMSVFDTIPAGLSPYPAYTVNTPITQSAGLRVCPSVAVDTVHNEVWLGGASYNAFPFQGSRISRFSLSGTVLPVIDETTAPSLPLGNAGGNARPIAIYFDRRGSGWIGFNLNKGIAVKNDFLGWTMVGFPSFMPAGTNVNPNAIAGNAKGEVFIGTTAGLLKYTSGAYSSASSYVLYTAALNHLPSNNVTGVTIDKSGLIWVATDAGIAYLREANFAVYNVRQPVVEANVMLADKFPVCLASDQLTDLTESSIKINVAADSSNSTLIVYTGSEPKSKVIKMLAATVANAYYTDQYGYFKELVRNDDSLVYLYRHPSYVAGGDNDKFIGYHFVVKDTVNLALLPFIDGEIRFYHPPVLMVHGVWSSIQSMKKLADSLVQSGLYSDFQVKRVFRNIADHAEAINSQVSYNNWVPDGIDAVLDNCRNNQLSAGKVDLIGHSRGGIFARLYTQSAVGIFYRNDVNKLITLNTPHFGSQTANLVLDRRTINGLPVTVGSVFGQFVLNGNKYNDPLTNEVKKYNDDKSGAVELKVNWPAIDDVLNGPTRLSENVPKHAVMTRYKFGQLSKANFLKAVVVNGVSGLVTYFVPVAGRELLTLRVYLLTLGTLCAEGPVDDCLKEIFNGEESDLVVPMISGKGGLPATAVSDFSQLFPTMNIGHTNKDLHGIAPDAISVTEKTEVMAQVLGLLRDNPSKAVSFPSTSRFTKDHFGATKLAYTFLPGLPGTPRISAPLSADSVRFENSFRNSNYLAGDSVWFSVKGNNLTHIIVSYESPSLNNAWSDIRDSTNGRFIFPIPKEASGTVTAVAMGFNDDGLVALDTAVINVALPTGITLDSIRIADRSNLYTLAKRDSLIVVVNGYYSDHVIRDITINTGLVYSTEEGNVASAVYGIKGIKTGYDRFFVAYQGKKDTAYAKVTNVTLPIPVPLPVTLSSFSGRYQNNNVVLNWITQQEINNLYFDIEASHDGQNFTSIGRVSANKNSSAGSGYAFTDHSFFNTGNNFYRLKQVDAKGGYAYSSVVLIKLTADKKPVVVIYPNPASTAVTISLGQHGNKDWQIHLYAVSGQLLYQKVLPEVQNQVLLHIENLPAGTYQLVISDRDGTIIYTGKVVRQ